MAAMLVNKATAIKRTAKVAGVVTDSPMQSTDWFKLGHVHGLVKIDSRVLCSISSSLHRPFLPPRFVLGCLTQRTHHLPHTSII